METTLPFGMKSVRLEVCYAGKNEDRIEVFCAAIPNTFVGSGIRGWKQPHHRGSFGFNVPAEMLVLDENKASSTWLQWRPWNKVFKNFLPS